MRFSRLTTRTTALLIALVLSLGVSVGLMPALGAAEARAKVLVATDPGAEATVAQAIERLGGKPGGLLKVMPGLEAEIPQDALPAVNALEHVTTVITQEDRLFTDAFWDAEKASSSLYQVARVIGADEFWKDGFDGKGVDVAVVDTGIADVPELHGRVVKGPDLSFDAGTRDGGTDRFGHGTHLAGIIGGVDPQVGGAASSLRDNAKKHLVGIAPGARLVDVKVGAADGGVDVSQVIAAIDWVVQNRDANGLKIRVLNLSYGTDGVQDYRTDPLTYAVENAWRHGIVVVVSAGNAGYGSPKLNNPAYDPNVIAVGASDTNRTPSKGDDFIADFSSRGDLARRPDVVVPGRSIVSLRAPGSAIDQLFPSARVNDRLFRGSGTSQAAAVVSGAAALLLQRYPQLTPDDVKAILMATGEKLKTRKGELLEEGMKTLSLDKSPGALKDLIEGKITSRQRAEPALGTGSIEAARGSEHVVADGVVLKGEVSVTGAAWDGRTWRDDAWNGRTWRGSDWAGRTWRASGWLGRTWRSDGWNGRTWRGSGWGAGEFLDAAP